jgi:hypothetical protein
MTELIFLYGTLRPGRAPEGMAGAVARLVRAGAGTIRARVYELGAYPGAVLDEFASLSGELFLVPDEATLVERFGLHAMGGFDAAMAGVVQQGIQRSPTPMQPDQLGLMKSPEVRAGLVLATFAMVSVCLLLMSALGGAFAGLLRMRRGRMA